MMSSNSSRALMVNLLNGSSGASRGTLDDELEKVSAAALGDPQQLRPTGGGCLMRHQAEPRGGGPFHKGGLARPVRL